MTLTTFRINTYTKTRGGVYIASKRFEIGKGVIPATITRSSTAPSQLESVPGQTMRDATCQNLKGLGAEPRKNPDSGHRNAPLRLRLG